jgi:hypothetical protein
LQIRITFDTFSLIFMARKLLTTIYYSGELQLGKGSKNNSSPGKVKAWPRTTRSAKYVFVPA